MSTLRSLTKRNTKLFFRDKGMFFTSLITPMILLVLYVTFLENVYRSSFEASIPEGFSFDTGMMSGLVGGELVSSLLAVCCVTVAFCSNMLMVQDKVTGSRGDLTIAPLKSSTLSLSYYISSALSTLLICVVATALGLSYLAFTGWYLSFIDILLILLDVFLLVMFGTALSSIINFFLSTQGQISAVGTIVSAGYGFLCGAYMPIASFSPSLQNIIAFLPGTYGTSLLRNHATRGVFAAMERSNIPSEYIERMKDSIDCNLYFFGSKVPIGAMYAILAGTVAALIAVYVLMNKFSRKVKA